MAQEEWFIKGHPELFKDNLDKWLFKELGIMGGCCSSQKAAEYITAREVGEKLQRAMIDKACEWLEENAGSYDRSESSFDFLQEEMIEDFRKAMEDET